MTPPSLWERSEMAEARGAAEVARDTGRGFMCGMGCGVRSAELVADTGHGCELRFYAGFARNGRNPSEVTKTRPKRVGDCR